MPLLKEEAYTIDDIYALPDGERAELIDGRMYMMAPPSRKHQRISTRLVSIIDRYIEEHKEKCEVYAAPFAVYLDEINLMIADAKVRLTGLLKLCHLQVRKWTTC